MDPFQPEIHDLCACGIARGVVVVEYGESRCRLYLSIPLGLVCSYCLKLLVYYIIVHCPFGQYHVHAASSNPVVDKCTVLFVSVMCSLAITSADSFLTSWISLQHKKSRCPYTWNGNSSELSKLKLRCTCVVCLSMRSCIYINLACTCQHRPSKLHSLDDLWCQ